MTTGLCRETTSACRPYFTWILAEVLKKARANSADIGCWFYPVETEDQRARQQRLRAKSMLAILEAIGIGIEWAHGHGRKTSGVTIPIPIAIPILLDRKKTVLVLI